jgi:Protein of unknown function (DUF4012)
VGGPSVPVSTTLSRSGAPPQPSRSRRRRRRVSLSRVLVWAVSAGAAVAAVLLSDAAPTGIAAVDAAFRALLVGLVTLASSRARRWSWLAATGLVCLAAPFPWLAVGLAALATSLAAAVFDVRRRDLSAAVGAAAALTALHLDVDHPVGASAALAAVALGCITVSGVRSLRRRHRRRVLVALAVTGAVGLACALVFTFVVLSIRGEAERAIDLARSGLTSVREGDAEAAVREFEDAEAAFRRAEESTGGFLAQPARLVPGLSQNVRALNVLAAAGSELASTGATTATEADIEALQLHGGAIDLDRVAAMEEPLAEARTALEDFDDALAEISSPWLVAPVGNAVDDLKERTTEALPDAQVALDAVRLAPEILGGNGPRTYFVAFVTPSELRGSGGILGNFAQLDAVDGRVELSRTGRNEDLNNASDPFLREITDMPEFTSRYSGWEPAQFWQNVTMSPDFPTTASVIEQLYFQSGGVPVDGVISVDPTALAALLRLTGPVDVPGLPAPLTHRNAEDILLRDQYIEFPARGDRADFLDEASRLTFEALTSRDLPAPQVIADSLSPAVQGDHLRAHSVHPEEQALFDRLDLDGAMAPVDVDYLGVVTQNGSANKIDIFLHRTVEYDVTLDPATGQATASVDITLTNDAPPSGLPDYVIGNSEELALGPGFSRVWLSVYTAMFLEGATADGEELEMAPGTELGRQVYSEFVTLAPGATMEIHLDLAGPLDLSEGYRLDVGHQPTVNDDEVDVTVRTGRAFEMDPVAGLEPSDEGLTGHATLTAPRSFVVALSRR